MINARISFITVCMIKCFLLQGCATAPAVDVSRNIRTTLRLTDLCERHDINWKWDSMTQVITLDRQGMLAKIMVGSDIAIVNDKKVLLDNSIMLDRGVVIIPSDFEGKVVKNLEKKVIPKIRRIRSIMIDPGHGGKDPGAISINNVYEKTIVFDISKRLKSILEENGFNAMLTRSADIFIPLEERAKITHRRKADLFVSIHSNSSKSRRTHGFEIYYLKNLDRQTKQEAHDPKNCEDVFSNFAMKKRCAILEKIVMELLYDYKQVESKKVSRHLVRSMQNISKIKNRGTFASGFSVLRNTLIPAVLVEVGYLSNKNEEKLLLNSEFRQEIAENIAKGIIEYAKE